MRVVWLSCHLPYPPISGGRLRELELLRRIAVDHDVHVVALSKDSGHDRRHLGALRAEVPLAGVDLLPVVPDDDAPCTIVGRHAAPGARAVVADAVERLDADLLHVEGFYLAQHVPPGADDLPLVLVDQNVEFDLWRQRAARPAARRADEVTTSQWHREAQRCQAAEVAAWRQATVCATVTEDDAEVVRVVAPDVEVHVVPDGCDHLPARARTERRSHDAVRRSPRLLYLGNYAYEPNVDAARLLVDEVLPRVRQVVPEARCSFVGNAPPDWLRARAGTDPLIEVTGRVPDLGPHFDACDVMVLPLRIGGGIKVKVLEGLQAGLPIVTTPVGAQGLPSRSGAPLVVAPEPVDLAGAVLDVVLDPGRRQALADAAVDVASGLPTWDDAAAALRAAYRRALQAVPTERTA